MEYQSPSALPLLAQVLIRIVAIKDYLLLRWKCSYHILFITEGKEIILRVEGTDALHQRAVTEEDGFIPIIVGASLLAYFLGVLCSRLVNG